MNEVICLIKARDTKIYGNTDLASRNYIPKFESFWICNKGETTTFLREPKTFDSVFRFKILNRKC